MWSVIVSGITSITKSWFELKKSKHESEAAYHQKLIQGEQDWDLEAMRQAQYSWKDEAITFIWYAPLVVAWFEPEEAMRWIDFVSSLPVWYQIGMFGIMAASFGLRWYFKQQNFLVNKSTD